MKRLLRLSVGFSLFILLAFLMNGCTDKIQTESVSKLSGTLLIDGSTTVYPIVTKVAEIFMQKNPRLTIIVSQSSSGEGYKKFVENKINISTATRAPTDFEYDNAYLQGTYLHMTVIANDAVAVIVNKNNPINDISSKDLRKIFFTGEISDWALLANSAKTGEINVYGSAHNLSGTADFFIAKISPGSTPVKDYRIISTPSQIISQTASDTNAIAFTSLKWVDDSVKLLSIDGEKPTPESILDGSNTFSRKLVVVTNGQPKGAALEFIRYILSEEGQRIVVNEGFVPVIR